MKIAEVKAAVKMMQAAEFLQAALGEFHEAMVAFEKKASDKALAHQIVKQAVDVSGMGKMKDSVAGFQETVLTKLVRGEHMTESVIVSDKLIPSHIYSPTTRQSANLVDKTDDKTFVKAVETIFEHGKFKAIERRLVASHFDEALLIKCAGLVSINKADTWSIRKA